MITPLQAAAEYGHIGCVTMMLRSKSRQTWHSRTLISNLPDMIVLVTLQAAAEHGHMGCVALILRSNPDKADLGNALWTAAAHGQSDTLPLLLEAGNISLCHHNRGQHFSECAPFA